MLLPHGHSLQHIAFPMPPHDPSRMILSHEYLHQSNQIQTIPYGMEVNQTGVFNERFVPLMYINPYTGFQQPTRVLNDVFDIKQKHIILNDSESHLHPIPSPEEVYLINVPRPVPKINSQIVTPTQETNDPNDVNQYPLRVWISEPEYRQVVQSRNNIENFACHTILKQKEVSKYKYFHDSGWPRQHENRKPLVVAPKNIRFGCNEYKLKGQKMINSIVFVDYELKSKGETIVTMGVEDFFHFKHQ